MCSFAVYGKTLSAGRKEERTLMDQITSINIDHEEIIEYTERIKELADILFYCSKWNFESLPNPTYE